MYCKKCGTRISDDANFCPHCGANQASVGNTYAPPAQSYRPPQYNDSYNQTPTSAGPNVCAIVGFVLSFFVPIAGLVLSIIGIKRAYLRGLAIAGVVISAVHLFFAFILFTIEPNIFWYLLFF